MNKLSGFRIEILDDLSSIEPVQWNGLDHQGFPFSRYEFLHALERHGCLGAELGWQPRHLALFDQDQLVAACPLYLKTNSYGEFVFDFTWAHAYERAGLAYYPKLISAIPYTPAVGPRLLIHPAYQGLNLENQLIDGALALASQLGVSSLHWLFPNPGQMTLLHDHGLLQRSDCQFHWYNQEYRDFDDFLGRLTANKRKMIKRERRRVSEAGITLEIRHGDQMDDLLWTLFHNFYSSTFWRKSGIPTLSLDFFREIGRTMADKVVVVLARHGEKYVAAAFNLRGDHSLYGRHWGCNSEYHSLHFEACYYQGIDYCIRHGLKVFQPGAQGEHKLSRGFLPTVTQSAHWIAHPGFHDAIADFLRRETPAIDHYMDSLWEHSPYKADDTAKAHE